ncbi:MAG: hypothetical protein ACI92I_000268 [Acidimicrobiales bacterium]
MPRFFSSDVVLKNNSDGTFKNVTDASGLGDTTFQSSNAKWIDIDGDLDLYITTHNENNYYLYVNGKFSEESEERYFEATV